MPQNKATDHPSQGSELKLAWAAPEALDSVFVDQLHIVAANGQFHLTLGQTRFQVGPGESVSGEIHPVSGLIISQAALVKMRDVIARALENAPK